MTINKGVPYMSLYNTAINQSYNSLLQLEDPFSMWRVTPKHHPYVITEWKYEW
jgi:hypothetical protein